jgi:colanic acid biosynthesis protein WcaH
MYIPEQDYRKVLTWLPILCVDLVIIHEKKCLLLKRGNEPALGQYWFPGGRINKLETIKEAAIRKAKEETNLNCEFVKSISIEETIFPKNENMGTDVHTLNICCHLIPNNIDSLKIDKDHDEYIWIGESSNTFHDAVNHPLSLMGFKINESLNLRTQL